MEQADTGDAVKCEIAVHDPGSGAPTALDTRVSALPIAPDRGRRGRRQRGTDETVPLDFDRFGVNRAAAQTGGGALSLDDAIHQMTVLTLSRPAARVTRPP
ncbi:hypothetical protein [Streptomyces sp. NK15101]|uniref:hypothetical protein n=1 Tax=Streptomyces sp. NK15101 TaxID=2873261 RepID=UPI001CECF1BC|nr:hypothetical protein [Streptomyces sp. NK15101]